MTMRFKQANAQAQAQFDSAAKEAYKRMREASKCVVEVEPMRRNEAHRPHGRPDGMPSRHENVPPVSLILMFNCHRAECRLTMGDISSMPDAEDVPLRSLESLQVLGRVKIAPDKGTPFMERPSKAKRSEVCSPIETIQSCCSASAADMRLVGSTVSNLPIKSLAGWEMFAQ